MSTRIAALADRARNFVDWSANIKPARRLIKIWSVNTVLTMGVIALCVLQDNWLCFAISCMTMIVNVVGLSVSIGRLERIRQVDEATAKMREELLAVGVRLD